MPVDACKTQSISRTLCPRAVALLTEIARPEFFGERHRRASRLRSSALEAFVLAKLGSIGGGNEGSVSCSFGGDSFGGASKRAFNDDWRPAGVAQRKRCRSL